MKKVSKFATALAFIITFMALFFSIYFHNNFSEMNFEQLLFAMTNLEGTSLSPAKEGIIVVVIGAICGIFIYGILLYLKNHCSKTVLEVKWKTKQKELILFPWQKLGLLSFICMILSLLFLLSSLHVFKYIKNQMKESDFYQYNYVDPKNVKMIFPKEKRNLIYIYLEATQSDIVSSTNGGVVSDSYIPGLEQLAISNLNFSQHNKIGGARVLSNTTWTIAGMVAQTAGITFNVPINGNMYSGIGSFMPGITSLGDILLENGYSNYLMIGSDATFAGRKDYYEQHGNYTILDYYTAIEQGKIDKDYYVWWGYEDKKLFSFAKEQLLEISKLDEPFNFTMLTADTHFYNGYLDETCKDTPFTHPYANVFYCNSYMVLDFIKWIQEQDFYQNTTIILSGDHYATQLLDGVDSEFRTYNVFINSATSTEYNKNREFATIDLFPTTLASLGVDIKGNKLGLGTNLFSGIPTLIEQYGYDTLNEELSLKSNFYNETILGKDYEKLLELNSN